MRKKCYHCNKPLEISSTPQRNVETYGGSVVVASQCCGYPYRITCEHRFFAEPVLTSKLTDDWNEKFKGKFEWKDIKHAEEIEV